jgi:hypothetical protein
VVAAVGVLDHRLDRVRRAHVRGSVGGTPTGRRRGRWRGLDDLDVATCGWVSWFNDERFRGEFGHLTPAEVEAGYYRDNAQTSAA